VHGSIHIQEDQLGAVGGQLRDKSINAHAPFCRKKKEVSVTFFNPTSVASTWHTLMYSSRGQQVEMNDIVISEISALEVIFVLNEQKEERRERERERSMTTLQCQTPA